MYAYQQTQQYFAQIADGFDELALRELTDLGAGNIRTAFRGIYFTADAAALYRINYTGSTISRVLAPLKTFRCRDRDELYRQAKSIRWSDFFELQQTFAVFANVAHSRIRHSKFAALCLKDGLVDFFRDRFGKRPNVNPLEPDVRIDLHLLHDQATISLDVSGGPLHRRGYRHKTADAPLQETLAAAIITLSGWDGRKPLYDPMCGSGTLLCEALIKYGRIPAALLRKRFGFEFLPDFDSRLWQQVRAEFRTRRRSLPAGLIAGSDISRQAAKAARSNCRLLPGGEHIEIRIRDYHQIEKLENRVIVCNPPYGIRLQSGANLGGFYKSLGDFLKQRCRGSEAFIYFGQRELIKSMGLKPSWKKPLKNAGLDGRLVKYELY